MNSFLENQRQIRIAIIAVAIIFTIGVAGFMIFEKFSLLDSIWLTVITLATIGYGDIVAHSPAGRIFTILLILFGLGAVAYGLQATAGFFLSPAVRDLRQRRRTQRHIDKLKNHFIICGAGKLVDETVKTLLESANADSHARHYFLNLFHTRESLLDIVVIVTPDPTFAVHLRENNLLVVEGDPTDDDVLKRAGVNHAQAMMVMLDDDTESLLTVLTARNLNPELDITAAALDEQLAAKMIRVGANGVIAHYDSAARFLNNATLRPAVSEFFSTILFTHNSAITTIPLDLAEDSPWIGQYLSNLELYQHFEAGVIGIRQSDGNYLYAPDEKSLLHENEVLITVVPVQNVAQLRAACRAPGAPQPRLSNWQRLPLQLKPHLLPDHIYSLEDSEKIVTEMSQHFIICGTGRVARNAVNQLDPSRPFVIISDDELYSDELIERGFRVIQGQPSQDSILRKAGVERALAIMVALDDDATSVLTVLNCRGFSKRLLITATAQTETMIPKLRRAGADRVITHFQVAAQFTLLATTRPAVSDFLQYVVYNYHAQIETTELYMQDDSPWIGSTIADLDLTRFKAGVIGVRKADGHYHYAPTSQFILKQNDVLIVVTPMMYADELRTLAHGSITRRPTSLRTGHLKDR
ncbi:MAG: hypothetical protein GC179_19220 [Anaerolineaceae bacterium]|nr:hypothetical protein [Anaerolineaceae bacterium]